MKMPYISIFIYIIYSYTRSIYTLQMLQQNKYNAKNTYLKWLKNNVKKSFHILDLLFIIIVPFIFLKNEDYISIVFSLTYITLIGIQTTTKSQNKKPLKYTARVKRLIFTNILVHLLPALLIPNITYKYLILGFIIYIDSLYILIALWINMPIEKMVGMYYKQKAKNKIKNMNNLKVVGITGSYGKTSSKNILNDILNIKYNTLPSPKNYNTPFGLMLTVNNYLDKFTDILIAEMGACQEHDIEELCELVHPKYGIITKIGVAHLATFGSREMIQKTKFELIENLPEDGIGILNKDDEWQRNYKIKNNCQIKWIGIDRKDADVIAQNIKLSKEGTTFDIVFKESNEKHSFQTRLLGYNSVYNILAAVTLGKELGMNIEQLKAGVSKVKPVEHRLQLRKNGNITIIDDAYNSNPDGAKMALDVLKMMPGKHIVVTPGMIELGKEEYQKNKEFGRQIAASADEVILVGKEKTKPILEGLQEEKFDETKITIINDVLKAFEIIDKHKNEETYALLENDLPDTFNE